MIIFFLAMLMITAAIIIYGSGPIIKKHRKYKKIFFSTTIGLIIISILGMILPGFISNMPKSTKQKNIETATIEFDKSLAQKDGGDTDTYTFKSDEQGNFKINFYTKNDENLKIQKSSKEDLLVNPDSLSDNKKNIQKKKEKNKYEITGNINKSDKYFYATVESSKKGYKDHFIFIKIKNNSKEYKTIENDKKQKKLLKDKKKAKQESIENKERAKEFKEFEAKEKAKKQKYKNNHPLFETQFPGSLRNYTSNDLFNHSVRFTGEVYGLGANSIGDYMVIIKNTSGQLMYTAIDHKKSGKLIQGTQITMYGQTNGKSRVREQDIDNLGVNYEDLDKPTLLMEVTKVINNN